MTDLKTAGLSGAEPQGKLAGGPRWLSQSLLSHDNSFNLLRFSAAILVLLSHAITVVTGNANNEPMRAWLGVTWGGVAVDVFFVASGLLVTDSMRRGDSALAFIASRALRILPGLVVSLVIMVTVASLVYWQRVNLMDALAYAARNSLPRGKMRVGIDGIFAGNPAGPGFNASLWTLPIEVRLYRDILLLWLGSFVFLRFRKKAFDALVLVVASYYAVMHLVIGPHASVEEAPVRLAYMFFSGAAALMLAKYIQLNWLAFGAALLAILASAFDRTAFFFSYSLLLPYVLLCMAYLPRGKILLFNKLGDYSYGIYIYAWPVQQLIIGMFPRISTLAHIAVTLPIVLALSMASWRFVEAPAGRLKKHFLRWRQGRAAIPV